MTVRMQALAKVNLGLHVLFRRPDSFHELRTVFQTISLADRLELDYQPGGAGALQFTCDRPDLEGPDNLAARAARRLLEATGCGGRVRIHLEKRIPVGAGLGGGSSDAAAVLRALGSLLRPRPARQVLWAVAEELGSDVPFFLVGGRALGLGRGTEVYPLPDIPRQWLVVVAPELPISTAEAYRRLSADLTTAAGKDKIDRFRSSVWAFEAGTPGAASPSVGRRLTQGFRVGPENDFEPVVFRRNPELEKLKARLMRLGACPALLCGSGSALFGMFADRRQALRARDSLALKHGRCLVVTTVGRSAFQARWRKWLGENECGH